MNVVMSQFPIENLIEKCAPDNRNIMSWVIALFKC